MVRGTFANIRLRNLMLPGTEGGLTKYQPTAEETSIYEAARRYREEDVPLVVVAGKEYGTGSSRDWAAKGTLLLGIKAVLAESYERIHRSNLLGMGVMPLQFLPGDSAESLKLDGSEQLSLAAVAELKPQQRIELTLERTDGTQQSLEVCTRLDTEQEVLYFKSGGILNHVLLQLMKH